MDIKIAELRPTQAVHGLREVQRKAEEYRSLSRHDLDMAIAEKPIPVVLGPNEQMYATDHHHVAAALWHVGVRKVPYILIRDLSGYSFNEFWLAMEAHRWTHPYDRKGRRIAFKDMPLKVWELEDDEYRSLAAAVRNAGGYEKTNVLLEEFRWADLFRSRLDRPTTDEEFHVAVSKALKLAASKAAEGLPGYLA